MVENIQLIKSKYCCLFTLKNAQLLIHIDEEDIDEKSINGIIEQNNTIEEISKKMIIIDKTIYRLGYNLNKNLAIDRFIIDMWRCDV